MPIRRNAAGEITGWFLYEDDPDLETLSDADRSRWPQLGELADYGKELRQPRQDAPEGQTGAPDSA